MNEWKAILEMDNEDGTHTCYCQMLVLNSECKLFIYCTENSSHTWDCEAMVQDCCIHDICHIAKTLNAAKSWWKRNLPKIVAEYNEEF